jgi:hypothetical protein
MHGTSFRRFKGLGNEEMLLYQTIKAAGNTGRLEQCCHRWHVRHLPRCRITTSTHLSGQVGRLLNSFALQYCWRHCLSPAGLWTKDMKTRTNLPQPHITKILKTLEARRLIKVCT